ncbi:GMC oxidoreductase domain-containing protein [Phthorimaea operculella]|nr:GMC oxidoreductase domain-containing protein [Phthorimaea operculella]
MGDFAAAVAAAESNVVNIQNAFHVISILNITSHLWPDQTPLEDGLHQEYDFIVVGAGSAGCVVAARLAEAEKHVLLIEAGGDPPIETIYPGLSSYLRNSSWDWKYTNEDDKCSGQCQKEKLLLSRGKVLGGTGSINTMIYVRGNPHDFNTWAQIANDSMWSYKEVLPFFKKSETLLDPTVLKSKYGKYHGKHGPMKVTTQVHDEMNPYLKAFEEVGYKTLLDINADDNIGYNQPMYNIAQGIRWSSAYAFISMNKDNPYLHVKMNTLVTKILFDNSNNAIGVEAIDENNKTVTYHVKNEVILSAGAFNSPQTLMLSGIGPKQHLESMGIEVISDLPVGENLQDQLGVPIIFSMDRSKSPIVPGLPQTEVGYYLTGYGAVNKTQTYPDYQAFVSRVPEDKTGSVSFCSVSSHLQDGICKQIYEIAKNRTMLLSSLASFHLKSRGHVKLKSKDPKDLALTSLGWFNEENDIDTVVKHVEDFIKVGDSEYFKSVDAELLLFDLPECKDVAKGTHDYWKCYVKCIWVTKYHYGGTCALGSVVDSRLRVKGVRNLRVADASVMPIITSGNTNAPTVMIAEKAAQLILDDFKKH